MRIGILIFEVIFFVTFHGGLEGMAEASGVPEEINPPIAERIPKIDTLHGEIRIDDYYWLRDKSNPRVIEYLEAENRYAEEMMGDGEGLQETLYRELLSRIKETDLSVPTRWDDYYYYSRSEEGKQYRIYCRKRGSLEATEEILLDQNELARGHEYYAIGIREISPDHRYLAYSVDTLGSERYTLYVKDLPAETLLPEAITNTGYGVAWASDCRTIFYTALDEARRPHKVYKHSIGTDPLRDVEVYHEGDEAFWANVSRTRSGEYIVISTSSWTSSEVHYLPAGHPDGELELLRKRAPGVEYYLEHHGDRFFIMTNEGGRNFALMETEILNRERDAWRVVIPHRDSVRIDSISAFRHHLVVYERQNGLKQIRIIDLEDREIHQIAFPEEVYTFWKAWNPDFEGSRLRFIYQSLVTPSSVFDYDMNARSWELKKQYEVLGGYDSDLYESKRVFAEASDGRSIPISLVYRRGLLRDGSNPAYLVGYGAYGSCEEPYFSSIRLSLLEGGFIYAIAHVRGGGEMGRIWHEEGRLLQKMNTLTDFIACAEKLIADGYTSSENLVITGGSAGGLLIGGVINMRPELFGVVVADVPFVDLINTMLDPSLPLTVLEWEEWGNPLEKEYYEYMKSYSPYDNVKAQEYPSILITSALTDTRVAFWEAAKWTAKLRAAKTDDHLLLLKTDMGTGHLGASGRYDYLRELAFEYAFVLRSLRIE